MDKPSNDFERTTERIIQALFDSEKNAKNKKRKMEEKRRYKKLEAVYSKTLLELLAMDFDVFTEVVGTGLYGKQYRIDAVISPKDKTDWKNKDIKFGVEFKRRTNINSGLGTMCQLFKQAVEYSYTDWVGFGRLPILVSPVIDVEPYGNVQFLQHMLGQFNVGQLGITHRGLSIVYNDSDFIWTDSEGVKLGKTWNLLP